MKIDYDILTGRSSEQLIDHNGFLLNTNTLEAFLKLKESLKGIDLQIVSAYRSFDRQLLIWNEKAQGKRKLFNRSGELLDFNSLTKKELLESILSWSAIPGASRHHWGTDLDVFDLSIKARNEVDLNNREYEEDFSLLTNSLNKLIDEDKSFSFFRPYSIDRGGVAKELWHISHAEISKEYLKEYTLELFEQNISNSNMELKELILENLQSTYKRFVTNI